METVKWTLDFGLERFRMGYESEPKNYEYKLTESDYVPSISSEKFLVVGVLCTEIISLALLLFSLN